MSPSALSSGLSPSLTSTLKMSAVCLASGQSLTLSLGSVSTPSQVPRPMLSSAGRECQALPNIKRTGPERAGTLGYGHTTGTAGRKEGRGWGD